jgi:hypothetical protein
MTHTITIDVSIDLSPKLEHSTIVIASPRRVA